MPGGTELSGIGAIVGNTSTHKRDFLQKRENGSPGAKILKKPAELFFFLYGATASLSLFGTHFP